MFKISWKLVFHREQTVDECAAVDRIPSFCRFFLMEGSDKYPVMSCSSAVHSTIVPSNMPLTTIPSFNTAK